MAARQYRALKRGYVDGVLVEAGEVFTHEFLGVERDDDGKIKRDKDGKAIRTKIKAPEWAEPVSAGEAAAIEAATDPFPDDPVFEEMTASELKAFAAAKGIDLGQAKKKDDIIAAIKAWDDPRR